MTDQAPARYTNTREVLEVFNGDEELTSYEVSNRVSFSSVPDDAAAVNGYLQTLEDRDFLERTGTRDGLITRRKTIKGRAETEMTVDEDDKDSRTP